MLTQLVFKIFILTLVFGFIFNAIFLVLRKFSHVDVMKKHHELAGYVISTLAVLYSIFLGLTATNAQKSHSQIVSRVNKEAYMLADLLMLTRSMPPDESVPLQKGIKLYIKAVVEDEWKLMEERKESPEALKRLSEFTSLVYKYKPDKNTEQLWFSEFLSTFSRFNSSRMERIYSSWESLGTLSWIVVISGAVVVGCSLLFFGTENRKAHILLNYLCIAYLTIMIFVIQAFNNPFSGPERITPKAYEVVFNYYNESHKNIQSPEDLNFFKESQR